MTRQLYPTKTPGRATDIGLQELNAIRFLGTLLQTESCSVVGAVSFGCRRNVKLADRVSRENCLFLALFFSLSS